MDISDASHLFSLPGAVACLTIHQADVLDADAVCRAVEGCKGFFHVPSPCTLEDPKDPQTELLLPAVQGTVNVMEAARKAYVRRIVLTSSIVPNPNWNSNKPFDESSWTDLDYCKARQKLAPGTYRPTHSRTLPPPDQVITTENKNILIRNLYYRAEEKLRPKRDASDNLVPEHGTKHARASPSY